MSPKVLTALSTPTTLGSVLLMASATLFALDVGGTFVLDSERFTTAGAAHGTNVHTVPRIAPPSARELLTVDVPAAVMFRRDASIASVDVPRRAAHHLRSQHAHGSQVPPETVRTEPIVPRHVTAQQNRVIARRLAARVPRSSRDQPWIVLAEAPFVSQIFANSRSRRNLALGPMANARPARATWTAIGRKTLAAHERRVAHSAPSHAHRTYVRAAATVALTMHSAVYARPRAVAFAAPATPTASLRDVRRFVMGKLRARDTSASVISSNTYSKDGTVLVFLVMRDKNHEWFEKDVVRRNGSRLAINATMLHTFAEKRRKAVAQPHPQTVAPGLPTTT